MTVLKETNIDWNYTFIYKWNYKCVHGENRPLDPNISKDDPYISKDKQEIFVQIS